MAATRGPTVVVRLVDLLAQHAPDGATVVVIPDSAAAPARSAVVDAAAYGGRVIAVVARVDEVGGVAVVLAPAPPGLRGDAAALRARAEAALAEAPAATIDPTSAELDRVRAAHARVSRALDAARAEADALRGHAEDLAARLARVQARLVAARRSVGFRLGRATAVALADRARPWRAPRRWLDTFRGPDELLADATRPPPAFRAPYVPRTDDPIARDLLAAVVAPRLGATAGIAGIAGRRLARDLAAAARWRDLAPHAWREALELDPPAYVLVTADGLAAGEAWSGCGTPGGRDGHHALRELVGWCRARGVPVVYWDTAGARADLGAPRGLAFDALFTVSAARAAAHGGAATLAPGIAAAAWPVTDVPTGAPVRPVFAGTDDRAAPRARLAALDALLHAAAPRGLVILDDSAGVAPAFAEAVRLPATLAGLARRRPPADAEAALVRDAGLVIAWSARSAADAVAWDALRAIALGAQVVTPGDVVDQALVGAITAASDAAAAAIALDRLLTRPRHDAAWRDALAHLRAAYALGDRLDAIARRLGIAPVATAAPGGAA